MKNKRYLFWFCLLFAGMAACGPKVRLPEDKTTTAIVTPIPTEPLAEASSVPGGADLQKPENTENSETEVPAKPVTVPEIRFLECLEMEYGYVVVKSVYDDFDNNGEYEMFAFVVEPEWMEQNSDDMLYGRAVFLNTALELNELTENFYIWDDTGVRTAALENRLLFVADEAFPSFVLSKVYTVYDGEPECILSGLGYFEECDGKLSVTVSAYDAVVEDSGLSSGHTWKRYYFYYEEETHSVIEYEAEEISKEQFLEWQGAAELLKEIVMVYEKPEFQFLYRENGMVHINISYREDGYTIQRNVSARLVDGVLTEPEENDGKYHLSCMEETEL